MRDVYFGPLFDGRRSLLVSYAGSANGAGSANDGPPRRGGDGPPGDRGPAVGGGDTPPPDHSRSLGTLMRALRARLRTWTSAGGPPHERRPGGPGPGGDTSDDAPSRVWPIRFTSNWNDWR